MANQGYFAGGGGTTDTTVDKMIFSTEITSSITSATLSVAGRSYGSTASNNTGGWGYFAGGQDGDSDPLSSIDKITFLIFLIEFGNLSYILSIFGCIFIRAFSFIYSSKWVSKNFITISNEYSLFLL